MFGLRVDWVLLQALALTWPRQYEAKCDGIVRLQKLMKLA